MILRCYVHLQNHTHLSHLLGEIKSEVHGFWSQVDLGFNSGFISYRLCDIGQVTQCL